MNTSVVFNADTLRILRQLNPADRNTISSAIMNRLVMGGDGAEGLSPMQTIVYSVIVSNIERASARYARQSEA